MQRSKPRGGLIASEIDEYNSIDEYIISFSFDDKGLKLII